jgi:S-methylmethionine-dependent homocysteine/selenocysteine methylase
MTLPQLNGGFYLTDGGIETTLIFHDGLDLPDFAAFHLLRDDRGTAALRRYFESYADLATRFGTGLVLESATWRASADWGARLGYDARALASANAHAVRMLDDLRREMQPGGEVVISGCVGPRGDGYQPDRLMTAAEAEAYHRAQVEVFKDSAADLITGITMNYIDEAVGLTRASARAGMPVVIAFTVETDGRLPTGEPLGAAIEAVEAATDRYPSYYMINCAHPSHFDQVLATGEPWTERVRGLRANASRKSHAELNDSTEIDIGDPMTFGQEHAALKRRVPSLNVMGGCCGTDPRHVEQIALACAPLFPGAVN